MFVCVCVCVLPTSFNVNFWYSTTEHKGSFRQGDFCHAHVLLWRLRIAAVNATQGTCCVDCIHSPTCCKLRGRNPNHYLWMILFKKHRNMCNRIHLQKMCPSKQNTLETKLLSSDSVCGKERSWSSNSEHSKGNGLPGPVPCMARMPWTKLFGKGLQSNKVRWTKRLRFMERWKCLRACAHGPMPVYTGVWIANSWTKKVSYSMHLRCTIRFTNLKMMTTTVPIVAILAAEQQAAAAAAAAAAGVVVGVGVVGVVVLEEVAVLVGSM